jgi:hypothetical protein
VWLPDGGDSLQIWRVAANTLNKQSRTADKGWPSSLGVGGESNNSPSKISFLQNVTNMSWTLMDSLDKQDKLRKMDMGFGTWNVRSLVRAGSLMTVEKKISKYKLDLVGVQEVR